MRVIAEKTAQVRIGREAEEKKDDGRLARQLPVAERFMSLARDAVEIPKEPETDRELKRRIEECHRLNGVPARYKTANLSQICEEALGCDGYTDAVVQLTGLMSKPGMVFLLGARGVGKTWMSCGLVNAFCDQGRYAKYMDAMDYFLELKATYERNSEKTQQQIEAGYIRPELLILDEVHERGDTQWEDRMLTRLVNKRYSAVLSTVLISNQKQDVFMDRVGESIADRVYDGGGLFVCDWGSMRGRIK